MKNIEQYIEEYQALGIEKIINYEEFSLMTITAYSTKIEGSTLTLNEAVLLLDSGITPKGKPLHDSLMVDDHHEALKFTLGYAEEGRDLNLDTIKRINGMVLKRTGGVVRTVLGDVHKEKGEIRKTSVSVHERIFGDSERELIDKLDLLLNNLKSQMMKASAFGEKIRTAFALQYNYVSIHPHYDGNGRTARLLMNMILRKFCLPLAVVYPEDKNEYYKAIEKSRTSGNIAWFLKFMENQYKKYLKSEISRFKRETKKGNGLAMLW